MSNIPRPHPPIRRDQLRPITAQPWRFHHLDGTTEECVKLRGDTGPVMIVGAEDLAEVASVFAAQVRRSTRATAQVKTIAGQKGEQ